MLTIPEAYKEDTGNYVVRAKNIAGEAKCYATLNVKVMGDKHVVKTRVVEASHTVPTSTIPGHKPPEFIKLFHDLRVQLGKPCHFEVVITGNPRPAVSSLFVFCGWCLCVILHCSATCSTTFFCFRNGLYVVKSK